MHVTSNPYFAFHDDVFPAFVKNTVTQLRFPSSKSSSKSIIPDDFFSTLKELKHISTVEMELNGTDGFKFEINFQENLRVFEPLKILQFNFYDEITFISFGISENGCLWLDSDYFDERFILQSTATELTELAFYFNSSYAIDVLEVSEEKFFRLFFLISNFHI